MGMPEVVYGMNHIYMSRPDRNFLYELSPVEALSFSAFAKREQYLKTKHVPQEGEDEEKKWNLIDLIPQNIEVK
eukprot:CAMPEP_0170542370 /NCGR_PEP_ID=MMETSP0211-20121228/1817_1 /TAXON_ID=311385 /ORGANISM="Pseudokeronopsis sp., Strain OXSARD2" /LENGTH=73 /DNA_ID=CAMNT_0010845407 /DNA_START=143 /DNA_END=364 /DNA_ORIENTATION=-